MRKFTACSFRYRIVVMAFPNSRLDVRDLAWRCILLSVAVAIVLAFLGPTMDHHFAERQHNHSHAYLSSTAADHFLPASHPFEEHNSHLGTGPEDAGHNGVLYLISNEGLGESGSVSNMTATDDGLAHLLEGGDFPSQTLEAGGSELSEAYIPPPERPPQV